MEGKSFRSIPTIPPLMVDVSRVEVVKEFLGVINILSETPVSTERQEDSSNIPWSSNRTRQVCQVDFSQGTFYGSSWACQERHTGSRKASQQ